MRLPDAFVLADRYRVLEAGSSPSTWVAESAEGGPGRVELRAPRYDLAEHDEDFAELRAAHDRAFSALRALHGAGCPAATPLERVVSYCPDPDLRPRLRALGLLRGEVWHVVARVEAPTLLAFAQSGAMDEERLLLVALRLLLLLRRARVRGVRFLRVRLDAFRVEPAGDDVLVVDASDAVVEAELGEAAPDLELGDELVPEGFGRALVTLLSGMRAPSWDAGDPRWRDLLEARRVGREFRTLLLGCLRFDDGVRATWDQTENRLRSLVRAFRETLWGVEPRGISVPSDLPPALVLDERFEVQRDFAHGARGRILLARDRASGADVLIKANRYRYDSADQFALELPSRREELLHEYATLRTLSGRSTHVPHPIALVRATGHGGWFELAPSLARDEPWLVLEKLPGRSLLHLLPDSSLGLAGASDPRNRVAPLRVVRIVERLAGILAHVHQAGFVYQDLKPDNVLFDPATEALHLVDFASACPFLEDGTLDRTSIAFGMQTHGFAAPEFRTLWEKVDARFDLYSLGALAWHLLTGVNPERVAVETGEEYPVLRRDLLAGLPPGVAELVEGCLAPLDARIPSALEVRRRAAMTRLRLSRSRPLDVEDVRAAWLAQGVQLRWRAPDDPRIVRVEVSVHEAGLPDRRITTTVEPPFYDPRSLDADRVYTIETVLLRRGEALHSRGLRVEVPCHPPPVRFVVERAYGGVEVSVELAAHAEAAHVVWRRGAPPADPADGEPLALDPAGSAFHVVESAEPIFYAAWALYAARRSVPVFASARPLPPLPDLRFDAIEQSDDDVRMRVEPSLPWVEVCAERGSARRPLARSGAWFVDRDAPRGATERYTASLRREGVVSAPCAAVEVLRWPAPPPVEVFESFGEVVVAVPAAGDGFAVPSIEAGDHPVRGPAAPTLPARWTVDAPNGGKVPLRVVFGWQGSGLGPTRALVPTVPRYRPSIALRVHTNVPPVRLALQLPADAPQWSGAWESGVDVVVESADGARRTERVAIERGRWVDAEDGGVESTFDLDGVLPDDRIWAQPFVVSPAGERRTGEAIELFAVETLASPRLAAELRRVVVLPPEVAAEDLAASFDLEITSEDARPIGVERVALPYNIPCAEGARVSVRMRRSSSRVVMPWSARTLIRALRRPDAPECVAIEADAHGVRFDVTVGAGRGEDRSGWRIRVAASDGRIVYEGPPASCWDVAWELPAWWDVWVMDGALLSEPVRVLRPDDPARGGQRSSAESASIGAPRGEGARVLALEAAQASATTHASVLRVVALGAWYVAECVGPPGPMEWCAVCDDDLAALQRRVTEIASTGARSEQAHLHFAEGTRELMVWPRRGRWCALLGRVGFDGLGRWTTYALPVEARAGVLVPAAFTRPDRLRLGLGEGGIRGCGSAEAVPELLAWRPGAGMRRVRLHDTDWFRRGRGWVLDGTVAADGASLSGLTLAPSDAGGSPSWDSALMVALVDEGRRSDARSRVWTDALRSLHRRIAWQVQRVLDAVVATRTLGTRSRVDLLVGGAHVSLRLHTRGVSADGAAVLDVALYAQRGLMSDRARVRLGDPVACERLVRTWSEHVRRSVSLRATEEESA